LAQCKLDLNHPYFQNSIGNSNDDLDFHEGLRILKSKVEAEHTSCYHVVQPMPGYPDCQNKIWKYDWSPVGQHATKRKSWRMVVIVPDPSFRPFQLIAAAVYPKNRTDQLSTKQLAKILASVTQPAPEEIQQEEPERFKRIVKLNGVFVSVCTDCGETVAESEHPSAMRDGEDAHDCPGPITARLSN
jgi:hypothetical protein